ncbi:MULTISPECIES: molybdenum cofactor guanylyltransferase MobA [Pseudomonas]|jgi:molybdopterin-guanine dinucleotide biosynthesis protein A|uniref:Molybdenum cofactor guanylyltransferase n=1 Tax=Pseudomonas syringae TaxID=317 RepID=A0A085VLS0_PSESX|nr:MULTISPECIES: molybdenum cofactor guanylyltransferase MobA [Pseudomonas]EPJ87631.1 molybdopterin-guanine dinucleotide biosynthesis protein MobA [Pseudomonas sp. CFII64]KFE56383.1 molybdopterin-guanine dinucleotide biosynthesis protein A [Pseudomonas syringae]
MSGSAPLPPCSILLLAGGQGQRMGGRDKGLVEWRGEPLIQHLHRLTRPLTDDLIISCNRNIEQYARYADQLVQDNNADFNGPLAGIRAALAVARHDVLLVLPCDVPLIDGELLRTLREMAFAHPDQPVMIREGEHWQPLLCMIPTRHAAAFEAAWQAGERSPRRTMEQFQPVAVQCAAGDPRLANFNTPDLLTRISV